VPYNAQANYFRPPLLIPTQNLQALLGFPKVSMRLCVKKSLHALLNQMIFLSHMCWISKRLWQACRQKVQSVYKELCILSFIWNASSTVSTNFSHFCPLRNPLWSVLARTVVWTGQCIEQLMLWWWVIAYAVLQWT
jgi:hypothetical protein